MGLTTMRGDQWSHNDGRTNQRRLFVKYLCWLSKQGMDIEMRDSGYQGEGRVWASHPPLSKQGHRPRPRRSCANCGQRRHFWKTARRLTSAPPKEEALLGSEMRLAMEKELREPKRPLEPDDLGGQKRQKRVYPTRKTGAHDNAFGNRRLSGADNRPGVFVARKAGLEAIPGGDTRNAGNSEAGAEGTSRKRKKHGANGMREQVFQRRKDSLPGIGAYTTREFHVRRAREENEKGNARPPATSESSKDLGVECPRVRKKRISGAAIPRGLVLSPRKHATSEESGGALGTLSKMALDVALSGSRISLDLISVSLRGNATAPVDRCETELMKEGKGECEKSRKC
uniref:Uncharacterized protein n=1 Tax=Steinernema glaseri TaxID=37863 RepID=A0A1I8A9V8_9BILA